MVHYQTIADDLRQRIESGIWAAGAKLPAESKLAEQYSVSVPTMRVALEQLQAEGLIERFQGKGTFVRRSRERARYHEARLRSGQQASTRVMLNVRVSNKEVEATTAIASLLRVEPGSPLTEWRFICDEGYFTVSLARVYVPHSVAQKSELLTNFLSRGRIHRAKELSPWGDDIRHLLAAAGVHVVSTVDRITSRPPTREEVKILRTNTPVLAVERISTDTTGRIVEAALLTLAGDRTEAVFTTRIHSMHFEEDR